MYGGAFVSSLGNTTLGFILHLIVIPLLGFILVFASVLKREGQVGLRSHLAKTFTLAAIVGFGAEVVVYLGVFVYQFASVAYEDHQDLNTRISKLRGEVDRQHRIDINSCAAERAALVDRVNSLKETVAFDNGEEETLKSQAMMQQGSIDNCQNQALKLLAPPEQKIQPRLVDLGSDEVGKYRKYEMLLLTNKSVFPVRVSVACNRPITAISHTLLAGSGVVMLSPTRKISSNEYEFGVMSPPWTQTDPLLIQLTLDGEGSSGYCPCNFHLAEP